MGFLAVKGVQKAPFWPLLDPFLDLFTFLKGFLVRDSQSPENRNGFSGLFPAGVHRCCQFACSRIKRMVIVHSLLIFFLPLRLKTLSINFSGSRAAQFTFKSLFKGRFVLPRCKIKRPLNKLKRAFFGPDLGSLVLFAQ